MKGVPDNPTPPWVQPQPADNFIYFCTPDATNDIPGLAVPGCAIPGYIAPGFNWELAIPTCVPWIVSITSYVPTSSLTPVCDTLFIEEWLQIDGTIRII